MHISLFKVKMHQRELYGLIVNKLIKGDTRFDFTNICYLCSLIWEEF